MSINWKQIWQNQQENIEDQVAITLLVLNGIPIDKLRQLEQTHIDLETGWLEFADGATYPLVKRSIEVLTTFYSDTINWVNYRKSVDNISQYEDSANRRLSGAIWFTGDEGSLILTATQQTDAPLLPLRFTFPFSVVDRLTINDTSDVAQDAQFVLNRAAQWLLDESLEPVTISIVDRLFNILKQGSLLFMLVSTGVSGLNLIHNVLMGRLLSPADYSQLTFIITLQLLIGLLPTTFQTVVARFGARYQAQNDTAILDVLAKQMSRLGWIIGLSIFALLLLLSPLLTSIFQLRDIGVILPLILFIPFFIAMGVGRGLLQSYHAYHSMSLAYLAEGGIRLLFGVVLGYGLLNAGRALDGAIWGFAQSMIATWFVSWFALRHIQARLNDGSNEEVVVDTSMERQQWQQLALVTISALIGQALITNSDFLLVKNFFTADEAGLYAAVSVLGRIVYFGALPLTIVLVPMVARRQALNQPTQPIFYMLIGGGTIVCSGLVIASAIFASTILGVLYGESYIQAAYLLAPYALAASLFTLTNLAVTYQIALGKGQSTWLPVVAGIAQIILVFVFHESLQQVVFIQIGLMSILLVVVLWQTVRGHRELPALPSPASAI